MIKLDLYEIYNKIYKALTKIYLGELYLEISSVKCILNSYEPNDIIALTPFEYELEIRYGRITDDENKKLDESMNLQFYADSTPEEVGAIFITKLEERM